MKWLRRVGWVLLLGGLACIIPLYSAGQARSRLAEEYFADQRSAAMDGGTRFPDAVRRLPYAEAKWKEAEAVHQRWFVPVLGGVGAGVLALVASFVASRVARRSDATRSEEVRGPDPDGRG